MVNNRIDRMFRSMNNLELLPDESDDNDNEFDEHDENHEHDNGKKRTNLFVRREFIRLCQTHNDEIYMFIIENRCIALHSKSMGFSSIILDENESMQRIEREEEFDLKKFIAR
jgi:hypothetical protein